MNAARFLLGLTLLLPTPACSQARRPQPFGDGALACSVYADAFSESNAGGPELAAAPSRSLRAMGRGVSFRLPPANVSGLLSACSGMPAGAGRFRAVVGL